MQSLGLELEFRLTIVYLLVLYIGIGWYFESVLRPLGLVRKRTKARRVVMLLLVLPIMAYLAAPIRLPGFEFTIGWPVFLRWIWVVPAMGAMMMRIWAYRAELPDEASDGPRGDFATARPYKWMRCPNDSATIALAISMAGMTANLYIGVWIVVVAAIFRLIVIEREQRALAMELGDDYREYIERTGVLLPKMGAVKKADYTVPRRFGIATVLVLVTALSILFGVLRATTAPPWLQLYIGSQILAICLAQIFFERSPRGASALAGAFLLPIWVISATFNEFRGDERFLIIATGFLAMFGALGGYCVGTIAAGFFLVVDLIEPWLPGGGGQHATDEAPLSKDD